MAEWQPIETSPWDGKTPFDCWFVLRPGHAARWTDCRRHPGNSFIYGGPTDQGDGKWVATHWMAQPEPPTKSE